MTITLEAGPADGPSRVSERLHALQAIRTVGLMETARPPQVRPPVPVYVLDLQDWREPLLANARRQGWRYLVEDLGSETAVEVTDSGGAAEVSSVLDGAAAERILAASRRAEEIAGDDSFAARLLDLRPYGPLLFWLAGDAEDRFYTLDEERPEPVPVRPALEAAARNAERAAEGSDRPDDVGG